MDIGITLLIVALCILLEAFFSGCEIAMISINRFKMEQMADQGSHSAEVILGLLNKPERLFATTSLGTNIAVVSSTAVYTEFLISRVGEWGDLASMLTISPLILFFGEIVPKVIFQNRADSIMMILVHPLNLICKVSSPFIYFFTAVYSFILRVLFRYDPTKTSPSVSRELIRHISHPDSVTSDLDLDEKRMINRIFMFGEMTAEQCMVPLIQVYGISDTATVRDANKIAIDTGFSRLPVYHERMFNLIGILNTFDLVSIPVDDSPITELIRPAYYVPRNKKADDLLKELQQRGLHMAVVVDEYGGCIGIVTVEDLLERIVGEIEDEYDKPEKLYEKYAKGGYLVDGEMEISLINEKLNLNLPEGDYDTIAGLIIDKLERIPASGEQITLGDLRLTVKDASKRKINSVILTKLTSEWPPAEPTQTSSTADSGQPQTDSGNGRPENTATTPSSGSKTTPA